VTRRRWVITLVSTAVALAAAAIAGGWWYQEQTAAKEVRGSSTVEFVPREKPQAKPRPKKIVDEVPWPTFGYDNQRTHLSPFNHRPPYRQLWLLRARWLVEFPPVAGYGKVFVSQLRGVFYAVDAKTGEWHWRRKFDYCSASSPALARGLVIATFIPQPCTKGPRGVPGLVIAMRQSDGRTVWKAPIPSETSPLVVGGRVYVGSWDRRIYALGLGTGKVLWSVRLDEEVNASGAYADGTVYFGDNSGTITALDARSGTVRWKAQSFSRLRSGREYFYATPTLDPDKLAEQVPAASRGALAELHVEFASLPWTRESLGAALKAAAARHGLKPPQIMMPLRYVVAGTPSTPAIDAVLALLGRDTTRARMAHGLGLR